MNTENQPNPQNGQTGIEPELLRKRELATLLGVSNRTVDYWVQRRTIPFVKMGRLVRFPKREILSHIAERFKVQSV